MLQAQDAALLRNTRVMRGQRSSFPTEIMLYADRIHTFTVTHTAAFATILQDESVASLHRASFEALWENLEPQA